MLGPGALGLFFLSLAIRNDAEARRGRVRGTAPAPAAGRERPAPSPPRRRSRPGALKRLRQVVLGRGLHARVGGGLLEPAPRELAVELRQVREQREIVERDSLRRAFGGLEPFDVGSRAEIGGARHGERLLGRAGREMDLDEIAPRTRGQVACTPGFLSHSLQRFHVNGARAALRGGARQPDLELIAGTAPQLARPLGVAQRPQRGREADARERAVAQLDRRVEPDPLEVPRRFARVAARKQRLGEIQARVAGCGPRRRPWSSLSR